MPHTIAQGELQVNGVFEFSQNCEETAGCAECRFRPLTGLRRVWYNLLVNLRNPSVGKGQNDACVSR